MKLGTKCLVEMGQDFSVEFSFADGLQGSY